VIHWDRPASEHNPALPSDVTLRTLGRRLKHEGHSRAEVLKLLKLDIAISTLDSNLVYESRPRHSREILPEYENNLTPERPDPVALSVKQRIAEKYGFASWEEYQAKSRWPRCASQP
jgi:hypothetical protein